MANVERSASIEAQIDLWRGYLRRRQAIQPVDAAELEDHLREQVDTLVAAGLSTDEAFLVAVKRMGELDALSREFAREHSERLWKQLVVIPSDGGESRSSARTDAMVAIACAAAAALAVKAPALFGKPMEDANEIFYVRNVSFFVLPLLTGYFAWKRQLESRVLLWLGAAFAVAMIVANVHRFSPQSDVELLTALHIPIALWMVVGAAYAGSRRNESDGRMDFIRFSGELFIYYVLIALGGGVFTAFLLMMFETIGIKAEWFVQRWLIPCGAAGAVVIASWLVEAKQSVIENMAPVLTRLFTPLFAVLLVCFLGALVWTGRGIDIKRELLIGFDLLLVVVLGLLLYSVSARDPRAAPGPFDVMQVVLLVSALAADAVALWAIGARITEFGFTPNRTAALGMNIILLVSLGWSAVLYVRFMRGQQPFTALERWQTRYLPVYSIWAAAVAIGFPLVFRSLR